MLPIKHNLQDKDLQQRLLALSYKHTLSHLGSCLTALPILEEIYRIKQPDEKFVLSAGHAGLALYIILEKYYNVDAEALYNQCGTHPVRGEYIDCSTGSLGMGLPVAAGMALADRTKRVFCLISDGECAEGSIWEALEFAHQQKLTNLKLYVNFNGFGGYGSIDTSRLEKRLTQFDLCFHFFHTDYADFPFLDGVDAHYHTLTEEEYEKTL